MSLRSSSCATRHRSLPTASPAFLPKVRSPSSATTNWVSPISRHPAPLRTTGTTPAIELNVVDPFTRRGVRFKGRAEIVKNDPEAHRRIAQILGPDYPFEQVVKIRVETAAEVFSPVYTRTRSSEAEVKRFWRERYGYRSAL